MFNKRAILLIFEGVFNKNFLSVEVLAPNTECVLGAKTSKLRKWYIGAL